MAHSSVWYRGFGLGALKSMRLLLNYGRKATFIDMHDFTIETVVRFFSCEARCFSMRMIKIETVIFPVINMCGPPTISVTAKQLPVLVFLCLHKHVHQTLSKKISNVCFNYTICLTIIITETTMTNRLEEPDSWAVIDNLDLEQEIEAEQQKFLFLAVVALSFLESYYARNLKPVQSAKWEHQQLDWNYHVTKCLHKFYCEFHMSFQAFNHLLELLRPSITVNAVKSNASSSLYSTNWSIMPELIHAISICWLAGKKLIDIHHVYGVLIHLFMQSLKHSLML